MAIPEQTPNWGPVQNSISDKDKNFIENATLYTIPHSLLGESVYTSPHGIEHTARVAAYALLLYAEIKKELFPEEVIPEWEVMVAGVCHDLGRLDDASDPAHGTRGAVRAALAMKGMVEGGLIPGDSFWQGEILHAILHHCDETKGSFLLSRILKDADKLDILRDGLDRLDTDRLYYSHSMNFVERAKQWSLKRWEFPDGLH